MDQKEHKNSWLLFGDFFVSTKLHWMEKSFYYLFMCSIYQKGEVLRPYYCGIQGISEEHVGRYSVITVMAFETCSQVTVQNFQAVPSSGYRSCRNPSDLPFLLLFCRHLAIPTQMVLPYWLMIQWVNLELQADWIIVWGIVTLDECINIHRCFCLWG